MTGIIVAMDAELNLLLQLMTDTQTHVVDDTFTYHCGKIGNRGVVATKCGIGKVNATIGALTLIDTYHPDLIINTGIAGGTGAGAGVMTLVLANEVAYHDTWCGPDTQWGAIQGMPARFRCAIDRIDLPALIERHPNLMAGLIASGDQFVSTPLQLRNVLRVQPDALAVDMESGAIAQVCHVKKVPFLVLRIVSDTPGVENHLDQYADFWNQAPAQNIDILRELI